MNLRISYRSWRVSPGDRNSSSRLAELAGPDVPSSPGGTDARTGGGPGWRPAARDSRDGSSEASGEGCPTFILRSRPFFASDGGILSTARYAVWTNRVTHIIAPVVDRGNSTLGTFALQDAGSPDDPGALPFLAEPPVGEGVQSPGTEACAHYSDQLNGPPGARRNGTGNLAESGGRTWNR